MNNNNKGHSAGAKGKKYGDRRKRLVVKWVSCLAICFIIWQCLSMTSSYDGDKAVWVRIPHGATETSVADSLKKALGDAYGGKVVHYWRGNPAGSRGAYLVEPGESAVSVARKIEKGRQTPVKLTFNNIRTVNQLAERLTQRMDWQDGEFIEAFVKEADKLGISPEVLAGRMMPDTYEVYWTTEPDKVIRKIIANYDNFWTDERKEKAQSLGLTPDEIVIIASIVEEETAKSDERGKVARLYVNRLNRGMKLQADPTVKYAVGDFSLKRVGGTMLDTDSPYNTYRYAGLPPGPIRIPDRRTLDAVLNAPEHEYIYMCARPDFSGYHDFTVDYAAHQRNAAAFRRALDERGIKL